jgi:DNA-3-methyladenine glycosylase I
VERLMADAGIVRNRAKILATIANARATLALRIDGHSLGALLWEHEPGRGQKAPAALGDVPASTAESKALSKALLQRGYRFVGPTTVYAAMQSLGVVNDHVKGCQFRAACLAEREAFSPPH